ncbi:MAG: Ldh family oxidoreductase [Candidatus Rokubacteria bacterium]|nr:Ldh family oxidoreductase [Candidatus Rokubacteria bacterium]
MRRFPAAALEAFIARARVAVGLPEADAREGGRLMTRADLRGADGHGIFRLPQYIRRIRPGGMNVRPAIRAVRETDAAALVDGDNGMGHLVMGFATRLAMDREGPPRAFAPAARPPPKPPPRGCSSVAGSAMP